MIFLGNTFLCATSYLKYQPHPNCKFEVIARNKFAQGTVQFIDQNTILEKVMLPR